MATSSSKVNDSVRILICSANLGNAKPDEDSLGAWVPYDGLSRKVIPPKGVRPEFPLIMDPRRAKNPPLPTILPEQQTQIQLQLKKQNSNGSSSDGGDELTTSTSHGATVCDESEYLEFENMFPRDIAMATAPDALENAFPPTPFGDFDNPTKPQGNLCLLDSANNGGSQSMEDLTDESQFDIIVIGMQEATFNMEDEAKKQAGGTIEQEEDMNDEDSESGSDDDEFDEYASGESTDDCTDDDDDVDGNKKHRRKSKVKKLGGALSKIGKVAGKSTMKIVKESVKVTNKVGKMTVSNAGKAKTLVTEKDNTNRDVPSPQQLQGSIEEELSTWSDTLVLHYMLEEQLPSYTRALSYQLGEMRLLIFFKDQSQQYEQLNLDVLGVKTQATGKHGLANKVRFDISPIYMEYLISMNLSYIVVRYILL